MCMRVLLSVLLLVYIECGFSQYYKKLSVIHREYELSTIPFERVIPSKHVKQSPTFLKTKDI